MSYFEMNNTIVEVEISDANLLHIPSSIMSGPSGVSQIAKQPSAVRNGQAKRSGTASPKVIHQPAYSVGVGYGNPLFWLASAALIKGAQILQPETMTAV